MAWVFSPMQLKKQGKKRTSRYQKKETMEKGPAHPVSSWIYNTQWPERSAGMQTPLI